MTQVSLGVRIHGAGWVLDEAALKKAVLDYKVGSHTKCHQSCLTVDPVAYGHHPDPDEAKKSRLKIPVIYGLDGMHGRPIR